MTFRRFVLLCAAVFLAAVLLVSCSKGGKIEDGKNNLKIYCFDAGKADAFVLTASGHAVIIDCGERGFGENIVSYLKDFGISEVDCLVITHFDKDHVGGAAQVIAEVPVKNVLQSNSPKDSREYDSYIEALTDADCVPETVRETFRFDVGGVKFTVDPPAEDEYENDPSNNSSLIVRVEFGSRSFLFTGDAENDRMEEYVLSGAASDCDVLKVPHHGRWDKKLKDLVAAVTPEYAVITSSDEETEDEQTVRLLQERNVKIFYTRTSPVVILCDGENYSVEYDK